MADEPGGSGPGGETSHMSPRMMKSISGRFEELTKNKSKAAVVARPVAGAEVVVGGSRYTRAQGQPEFEVNPLQDRDGLCEQLFHYLWRKNGNGQTCPGVYLPDTIVYKYQQPAYWFFTSKSDYQIKRKNRANVLNANILEALSKRKKLDAEMDCCAYYIDSQGTQMAADSARKKRSAESATPLRLGDGVETRIQYFNDETLRKFLFHGQKNEAAILQRFVAPSGEANNIIRATWSPQVCLLERRANCRRLLDVKVAMTDRLVTFEAAAYNSESEPLTGTVLPSRIQRVCSNIVEHVLATTNQLFCISRMELNFKLDVSGRLWLLWCSSLRLADHDFYTPKNAPPLGLDTLFELQQSMVSARKGHAELRSDIFACPGCGLSHPLANRFDVTYKMVMLHHRQQLIAGGLSLAAAAAEMARTIPPILARIDRVLNAKNYSHLRRDPTFLYRTVGMCEPCCLAHNATQLGLLRLEQPGAPARPRSSPIFASLAATDPRPRTAAGTGGRLMSALPAVGIQLLPRYRLELPNHPAVTFLRPLTASGPATPTPSPAAPPLAVLRPATAGDVPTRPHGVYHRPSLSALAAARSARAPAPTTPLGVEDDEILYSATAEAASLDAEAAAHGVATPSATPHRTTVDAAWPDELIAVTHHHDSGAPPPGVTSVTGGHALTALAEDGDDPTPAVRGYTHHPHSAAFAARAAAAAAAAGRQAAAAAASSVAAAAATGAAGVAAAASIYGVPAPVPAWLRAPKPTSVSPRRLPESVRGGATGGADAPIPGDGPADVGSPTSGDGTLDTKRLGRIYAAIGRARAQSATPRGWGAMRGPPRRSSARAGGGGGGGRGSRAVVAVAAAAATGQGDGGASVGGTAGGGRQDGEGAAPAGDNPGPEPTVDVTADDDGGGDKPVERLLRMFSGAGADGATPGGPPRPTATWHAEDVPASGPDDGAADGPAPVEPGPSGGNGEELTEQERAFLLQEISK